jgi:nitrite reductase/ring-hydroxylating ferredoxin subunit/uncharacterized membrane protein
MTRPAARALRTVLSGRLRRVLQGVPLGEPLHPVLTDVVIGSWTSSFVLDLVGGRRSRRAARLLVGVGVLSAVPTMASGAADWLEIDEKGQRVGTVHALVNMVATTAYGASWMARRRGMHARGVVLGLVGATVATVGAGLGGYLVYRRATGVNRSIADTKPTEWTEVDAVPDSASPIGVEVAGGRVVLCRTRAGVFALGDTCSHQGAALHGGTVGEDCIRCPWHGSVFRLADGAVLEGPATSPQPRFEVRRDGGSTRIRFAREDGLDGRGP